MAFSLIPLPEQGRDDDEIVGTGNVCPLYKSAHLSIRTAPNFTGEETDGLTEISPVNSSIEGGFGTPGSDLSPTGKGNERHHAGMMMDDTSAIIQMRRGSFTKHSASGSNAEDTGRMEPSSDDPDHHAAESFSDGAEMSEKLVQTRKLVETEFFRHQCTISQSDSINASNTLDDEKQGEPKHVTFPPMMATDGGDLPHMLMALGASEVAHLQSSAEEWENRCMDALDENRVLQQHVAYLRACLDEMQAVNRHCQQVLATMQNAVSRKTSSHKSLLSGLTKSTGSTKVQNDATVTPTWLAGNWLAGSSQTLEPAEAAWARNLADDALLLLRNTASQRAEAAELALKKGNLKQEAQMIHDVALAYLLQSAILRSSPSEPNSCSQALEAAELAVAMAHKIDDTSLLGRAQFHRGLAFFGLNYFAEAAWCLQAASATPGHDQAVQVNLELAEAGRTDLALGDPRRFLSADFCHLPRLEDLEAVAQESSETMVSIHSADELTEVDINAD